MPDEILIQHPYAGLLDGAKTLPRLRVAIVHPVSSDAIEAAADAASHGLIEPVLIGPAARIRDAAGAVDISRWEIIDTEHSHAAAETAVGLAASGRVDALMKGALHSDELLRPVVAAGSGLRTERRISHAYLLDVPTYPKPLIITDAAVNITPDLAAKADICRNAIALWRSLFGEDRPPKLAVLAAVETVTADMPSTLDAAALCKMSDRGQITGAIIDGPLAYDNIISREAAADKGIVSEVAGDADIVLVPNIETGNALAKQLIYLGGAQAAGIVLGARVPIILTSRADSQATRLMSCVCAVYLAAARRQGRIK
ncbi:phosphate butyryltransferase [Asticcacaulis biprosthecium C19]|uniref:Phosphate butyryltransferase n=1 Tax=Asticcacaulis biprosthecium C19 TaxID=715226 RepID=F4QTF8_9CAUL|nr:bifunctional enoyl-CoA hydratase/phosphate acetyltransferase [Asticcacaulis biprosthecium]EGF90028.1 phosphate butyryltransferase [Asticcacaulis biprosthecium C19]